jgi:hypothetical protein
VWSNTRPAKLSKASPFGVLCSSESPAERGALQRLVDTLTCSNPEPLASIKELPLGPLDLAWYMLAEAEISSERDVSIVKSLHSKLKDGPILFIELLLRNRWITMDVLNSDSARFARHLLDYLAGVAKFGFGGALLLDLLGAWAVQRLLAARW